MYLGTHRRDRRPRADLERAAHPYTALLAAAPIADPRTARSRTRQRPLLQGELPSPPQSAARLRLQYALPDRPGALQGRRGRRCGRCRAARWPRAISSELAMIRRMTKSLAAVLTAALIFPAAAAAQTIDSTVRRPARPSPTTAAPRRWPRGATAWTAPWRSSEGKPFKLRALLFSNPSPEAATCRPSSTR